MTEPLTPLTDEDLSAALDGVAEPDVVARIQADPAARVRMEALRAASDALRAPVTPLPDDVVDQLIERALSVTGEEPGPEGSVEGGSDNVVAPLAPRRRQSPRTQQWLVAAVIAALVAIGMGLVWSGTRSDQGQDAAVGTHEDRNAAASSGDSSETPHGEPGRPSPTPGGSTDGAMPTEAEDPVSSVDVAELDELGSFEDISSLRAVLRSGFPDDSEPATGADVPSVAAVNRCTDMIGTILESVGLADKPDEVGFATIDGRRYIVYEFSITGTNIPGSKLITAADPVSCAQLFQFVR